MISDQIVAALVAEGYSRDSIRTAMNTLMDDDWREEDEDWTQKDLRTLREKLGPPAADGGDEQPADESDLPADVANDRGNPTDQPDALPADVPNDSDPTDQPEELSAEVEALLSDTSVWAADLARVLDRATAEKFPFDPRQTLRVANHLLHRSSGLWDPETRKPRVYDAPDAPDFTVSHWADSIDEALHAGMNGEVELSRVELQVAANLLLHAQEDDWVPQAALVREAYESRTGDPS